MSWDITLPAGSEAVSNGDNRIRELKTDLQTALRGNTTDGLEAKFPGSDAANPVFRYRGLKGTTAARPAFGQYGLYHNETLNTIQRDNGSAWEDVATLIPSGTKMPFYQASPPVGWTAVAVNDKFMRVVTSGGTGGTTGGTVAASTSLAHTHTVSAHNHTFAHTHASTVALETDGTSLVNTLGGASKAIADVGGNAVACVDVTAGSYPRLTKQSSGNTTSQSTSTSGDSSPSTDSQLGVFAYADFCVGTKD